MTARFPWFRPNDAWITCRDRDDGGGAQIMARASAMICARLRGLRYAHSPLGEVAHAPTGLSPAAWSAAWENFFAIGKDEIPAAEIEASGRHVRPIPKPHRCRFRSRTLHVVAHCHKLTDRHPEAWGQIAPLLRKRYLSTPKPELPADPPDAIRIAVHLRRGDVGAAGQFSERFTPNAAVLARLARLLDALGPDRHRASVRIFSQGQPDDFAAFSGLGASLHLDDDVFTSFHQMFSAHVLLTAKSTFSYLAGLLGGALCLYEPFRHPPLPGWLDPAALASLPADTLARAVHDAVRRRQKDHFGA